MSEAKRCDRCNNFYSIDDENEKRGEYQPASISYKKRVYSMTLYDKNVNRIKHFDLCPACSRSLMVWFKLTTVKQHVAAEETEKAKEKDITAEETEKTCDFCKYKDVLAECNPCMFCGPFNNFEPEEDKE